MGEDSAFMRRVPFSAVHALSQVELNVCMIHGQNVAPKQTSSRNWRPVPVREIQRVWGRTGALCAGVARAWQSQ